MKCKFREIPASLAPSEVQRKPPVGQIPRYEAKAITDPAPSNIKHHLREIGRLGGLAGKGSPHRQASAKKAINARWDKERQLTGKIEIIIQPGRMFFSDVVPAIHKSLTVNEQTREGNHIRSHEVTFLLNDGSRRWTFPSFLTRVKKALKYAEVPYRIRSGYRLPPRARFNDLAFGGVKNREVRALKKLERLPFGGVLIARDGRMLDMLTTIVMGYPDTGVVVVVNTDEELNRIHHLLMHCLSEPIGLLTRQSANSERVVITTPQQFRTGVISPADVGLLVVVKPPKKGNAYLKHVLPFNHSFRVGLTDEPPSVAYAMRWEAAFGPVVEVASR